MTSETHEKEILEKLERIEETLTNLSGGVDMLTRGMKNILETIRKDGLARYKDSDLEQYEKPPNPWALKSIKRDKRIKANFEILKRTENLLPTLKALKSSPNGLTAKEVSEITKRDEADETEYLSNMYMLGIVDKTEFGEKAKYRLGAERWIPKNIKNQIF